MPATAIDETKSNYPFRRVIERAPYVGPKRSARWVVECIAPHPKEPGKLCGIIYTTSRQHMSTTPNGKCRRCMHSGKGRYGKGT